MKFLHEYPRAYKCRCHNALFFRNTHCLKCASPLGYEPEMAQVCALDPGPVENTWSIGSEIYRRCANLHTAAACNWLVKVRADGSAPAYCTSCQLNRIIPDLTFSDNAILWKRLEDAKRSVVATLVTLGLSMNGMRFAFLRSPSGGPRIITGHENGLITINIEEADDVTREQMRTSMREPYRTLVGHFRHEIGHFYWDRLIAGSSWLNEFRNLFGDEREDYLWALQRNYGRGPMPGWERKHVSAYASTHPWEDWAETWAHYMHMVDTLGTAVSFGLEPDSLALPFDCFGEDSLYRPDPESAVPFLSLLNGWLKLTAVMNELCRSMGQTDFYPFALSQAAVTKLHFVHLVASEAGLRYRDAAVAVPTDDRTQSTIRGSGNNPCVAIV